MTKRWRKCGANQSKCRVSLPACCSFLEFFSGTLCISQFHLRPAPPSPSRATAAHLPARVSPVVGICKFCTARGPGICQLRGHSQAFDMHAVSYQNITTQKVLLEKKQIGSSVKGRNKMEEGCKGKFSILCMHFIAYQAIIT